MDKVFKVINNVFGKSEVSGKLLELFKGQRQKQREFELELKKLLHAEMTKEFQDLADARDMQKAALAQNDLFSKRFVYYLAAGLLLATTLISLLPFFVNIPQDSMNLVNRGTDFFYTVSGGSIIAFFFGAKVDK
ncbi:hypothetical protein [Flagellimonas algicola]|uniref:Holin (3TMs family) n=1 Tax=Flagellimonas algicola TaxID=2583815 RepID=A0ABY2WP76_9FLAO|nr:hypothetical protein [Allomuricauda algicola]TMU56471.1 hypothetical protein FGG15_02730 [Allomuricauda algicola]